MRKLLDNKKGQAVAGLDLSKSFIIGLLALAIIGVLIVIVLVELGDIQGTTTTAVVTNESGSASEGLNATANFTTNQASVVNGFTLVSIQAVYNSSQFNVSNASSPYNGSLVPSSNYTFTSAGLIYRTGSDVVYPNINVSYTYTRYNDAGNTINNVTTAVPSFFANAGTWLTLLSVVVIVLLTVAVIRIFGGRREETSL